MHYSLISAGRNNLINRSSTQYAVLVYDKLLHYHSYPSFPQNVSDFDSQVIDFQFKNAQIMFKTTFSFEVGYLIASCC